MHILLKRSGWAGAADIGEAEVGLCITWVPGCDPCGVTESLT